MKLFLMTLRMALRALQRNKLRSALTMLGIVIGVAAVITMVSIGAGAEAVVQQEIVSLGNNLLAVVPGATTANGVRSGWGSRATLTVSDALAIQQDCPAVADVSYTLKQTVQVIAGNQNWATVAKGVSPSYQRVSAWPMRAGSFFAQREAESAAQVVVLGQTVVEHCTIPGHHPQRVRVGIRRRGAAAAGESQSDHGEHDNGRVPRAHVIRRASSAAGSRASRARSAACRVRAASRRALTSAPRARSGTRVRTPAGTTSWSVRASRDRTS